jgi:hypothetical protein
VRDSLVLVLMVEVDEVLRSTARGDSLVLVMIIGISIGTYVYVYTLVHMCMSLVHMCMSLVHMCMA